MNEKHLFLFVCKMGEISSAKHNKLLRSLRGYQKIDSRSGEDVLYKKDGVLKKLDEGFEWLGDGNFMVTTDNNGKYLVMNELAVFGVKVRVYKTEYDSEN